jgi:hypothetical protein
MIFQLPTREYVLTMKFSRTVIEVMVVVDQPTWYAPTKFFGLTSQ